jgi:hypothetical protein
MNKQTRSLLSLAGGVLPVILTAQAGQAVSLSLLATPASSVTGDPVQVSVKISDLGSFQPPSLSGFDFQLSYSPSTLQFNSISFGDPGLGDLVNLSNIPGLTSFSNPSPGVVNFAEISLDNSTDLNAAQPSSFILATLNFKTINPGTSLLSLSVLDLADENTQPITFTPPESIIVSVTPSTHVPEPGLGWLSLAGTFLLAVFILKKQSISQ